jgi:hypothetical protein
VIKHKSCTYAALHNISVFRLLSIGPHYSTFDDVVYVEGMTLFSYECAVKLHYRVEFLYAENDLKELELKMEGKIK